MVKGWFGGAEKIDQAQSFTRRRIDHGLQISVCSDTVLETLMERTVIAIDIARKVF